MVVQINPFQPRWISRLKNDVYCFIQRYKSLSVYDRTLDAALAFASICNIVFIVLAMNDVFDAKIVSIIHMVQLLIVPFFLLDMARTAWKIRDPSAFIRYHWFDVSVLTLVWGVFGFPVYPRTGRSAYLLRNQRLHRVHKYYPYAKVRHWIEIMELRR